MFEQFGQLNFLMFFGLLFGIAFLSHKTTSYIFSILYRITRKEHISLYGIALLYLPGTFLHEVAHLIGALAVFLPVFRFSIFPKVNRHSQGIEVILGSVQYVRKDPVRSFLVGIAPIFLGIIFFYFLPDLIDTFDGGLFVRVLVIYLAFTVASTMISSKKDLEDAIFMIPLVMVAGAVLFFYKIDIFGNRLLLEFVSQMNYYLTTAFLLNGIMYLGTKLLLRF